MCSWTVVLVVWVFPIVILTLCSKLTNQYLQIVIVKFYCNLHISLFISFLIDFCEWDEQFINPTVFLLFFQFYFLCSIISITSRPALSASSLSSFICLLVIILFEFFSANIQEIVEKQKLFVLNFVKSLIGTLQTLFSTFYNDLK